MGVYVERDFTARSPWNPMSKNIHGGNEYAEEKRKQNRDRIEKERGIPMSSLGRVKGNIGRQEAIVTETVDSPQKVKIPRRTRGKGRVIKPKI